MRAALPGLLLLAACLLSLEVRAAHGLYVWAKNGLVLRATPDKNGKKIRTLPYGTKVDYLRLVSEDSILIIPAFKQANGTSTEAYFLRGDWAKVQIGAETEFLFDGYLSEMQPSKGIGISDV
jgi:hypothetical protein